MSSLIITYVVIFIISLFIGNYVGDNRRIGGFWSMFFSITFSPVVGYIVSICSQKIKDDHRLQTVPESRAQLIRRYLIGLIFLLTGIYFAVLIFVFPMSETEHIHVGVIGIGLVGSSVYIFNSKPVIQVHLGDKPTSTAILKTRDDALVNGTPIFRAPASTTISNFLKVIFIRILVFIPLIWLSYIFTLQTLVELPLRVLFSVAAISVFNLFTKITYNKMPPLFWKEDSNLQELRWDHDSTSAPTLFHKRIWYTFLLWSHNSYKIFNSRSNIFKMLDLCTLIFFFVILTGNPYLGNYIGVSETFDEYLEGEEGRKILLNAQNISYSYADYGLDGDSYTTTEFMFKETGYLKGFFPPNLRPAQEFSDFLKATQGIIIGFFTSLVESVAKSLIWVALIYTFIGFPLFLKNMRGFNE